MRILLLEDNTLTRTIMRHTLESRGWEVRSFPEPAACPLFHDAQCKCEDPDGCVDAIVTDFDMPQMNGCCFVEALLAKGCRVKRIALLSDNPPPTAVDHARKLGCAVFSKSEGVSALLHWLEQVEQSTRSRQLARPVQANPDPGCETQPGLSA